MTDKRPNGELGMQHLVGEIEGAALRQALSTLGLDPARVVTFLSEGTQPTLAHLTLAYAEVTLDRARATAAGLSPSTVDDLALALQKLKFTKETDRS